MLSYTKKGNNAELNNILKDFLCCIILNDNLQGWFQCLQAKVHYKNIYCQDINFL